MPLSHGGEQRIYDLSITPLRDQRGALLGRLISLHDITELKQAKETAEQALASVRTLSGLLPICALCKSIRDDQGYWLAVEEYVSDHTGVEFTHGMCPDCTGQYYPELAEDIKALEKGRAAALPADEPSSAADCVA